MRAADLALTNGAMSAVFAVLSLLANFGFVMASHYGPDAPAMVRVPYGLLAAVAIVVFVACLASFRGLYVLFGRSDRRWFYPVAVFVDLGWLCLAGGVFFLINRP